MNSIQKFISTKQEMLDRGIVATPTEDLLEAFAKANHGTNDFLLMQMAKNYIRMFIMIRRKDWYILPPV